jgi:hypothetical protein
MKSLFKNAEYIKKHYEDLPRQQGRTKGGSQIEGLRLIRNLTADGSTVAPGTLITTEFGEHISYDGTSRIIDYDVFKQKVEEEKKRKKEIHDQIEELLWGGDSVAVTYMGPYYNMLLAGNVEGKNEEYNNMWDTLEKWMLLDGFSATQTKSHFALIGVKGVEIDATPSSITFENETSNEYTKKIMKLALVLRYANLIFTNRDIHANVEIPGGTGEKLFTPDPSERGKYDVTVNRRDRFPIDKLPIKIDK